MTTTIQHCSLWEGEPLILVGRIVDPITGQPLVIADITSFSVEVFLDSETPEYALGSISPATAFFDTLQVGAQNLLGDSGGYNFKYVISTDDFRFLGGNTYRIQVVSIIGGSEHVSVCMLAVGERY